MEPVLFRTGSGLVPIPNGSIHVKKSSSGVFARQLEPNRKGICRASSESDKYISCSLFERSDTQSERSGNRLLETSCNRSVFERSGRRSGFSERSCSLSAFERSCMRSGFSRSCRPSESFTYGVLEEDCVSDMDCLSREMISIGSLVDELGFPGGGIGTRIGGNSGGGGGGDRRKIGGYYEEMLKSNPSDSLLLRNYGKYLHEVEGDMEKAEQCYGRSILASPGDAEVLSLYGKLIWEKEKDELRAKSYFDQALHASPHDCTMLGSYAQFLWEAEEGEEDEIASSVAGPAMVVAN